MDDETLSELRKELEFHQVVLMSNNELTVGIKTFNSSFENENYVEDIVYQAIDLINTAMKIAFEVDTETEALCSAHLGKIFYRGLKNLEKGKTHYNDCIRILETLKPKVFNEEKWYQLMVKHMIEIQQALNKKEEDERQESEKAIRKTVQKELDELKKNEDSYAQYLEFVGEKYTSYVTGKTLTFTAEQLESKNIKKTLTRTCLHYHSDKSVKAKADGMSEGQIYLRAEIIKTLTRFINEIKDVNKPSEQQDTSAEEEPEDSKQADGSQENEGKDDDQKD